MAQVRHREDCCGTKISAFQHFKDSGTFAEKIVAQAVTPHVCSGGAAAGGSFKCQGTECGDDTTGNRDEAICDKSGCDFNPYRLGATIFYGNGSKFAVDTTKPFTIVITADDTDTGELTEIRRKYVQNGIIERHHRVYDVIGFMTSSFMTLCRKPEHQRSAVANCNINANSFLSFLLEMQR